ncbi:MAG: hypothetical protein RLZZ156_341 [Deinococcota bacterium]
MKRLFLVMLFSFFFMGQSHASSPLDWLQQACSFTRAKWVCQTADSALLAKALVDGSWNRAQASAQRIAMGWIQDAVQTAGENICTDSTQTGQPSICLSQMSANISNWLNTAPDALYDQLFDTARQFYLSNLLRTFNGTTGAQPGSPTALAEEAIRTQPNAKAKYFKAYAEDLQQLEKETAMGKIFENSRNKIKPPDPTKGERDPYLEFIAELNRPACDPANPLTCLDPLNPQGGWAAQKKARAATAVSTREQLQTLVELQAEASSNDALNTLELRGQLQKMAIIQVNTNEQLKMIYEALTSDKKNKQAEYKASLERSLSNTFSTGHQAAANFSSAAQLMLDNANPQPVLDFVLRY